MKKIAAVLLVTLTTGLVFHAHATDVALSAGGDIAAAITETGGSGTITLAAGTYTLAGEITVPSGVTITGAGSGDDGSIITSSSSTTRYMTISGGTVNGVKIQGQKLTSRNTEGMGVNMTGGTLRHCRVTGFSVGQYFQYGTVKVNNKDALVEDCEIDANNNTNGEGVNHYAAGVYLVAGTVRNCRIHDNISNSGSGVKITGGTLENCCIYANQMTHISKGADTMGSAVWATGGTITGCTIAGNAASTYGGVGGLYLDGANIVVSNSTICGNIAYNSTSVGFPDFAYNNASVASKVSDCRLPVDFGTNANTNPAFFTSNWVVCPFTADKTEVFVGETITFTDKNGASWTVSETSGIHDVTRTVDGAEYTAKNAVRFAPETITVSTADDLIAAVNGAVDGETIIVAKGEYALPSALIVTRAITLEGAGMMDTVLKLKSKVYDRVLMLTNAGASVKKLTAKGGAINVYANNKEDSVYDVFGITAWVADRGGTLEECRITGGTAGSHYERGNLAVTGADGYVNRCLIDNNNNCFQSYSGRGGGIYLLAGLVENCIVTNNFGAYGGGAYVKGGTLRNCTFYKNKTLNGGTLHATGGTILDCVTAGSTTTKTATTGSPEWDGTVSYFDTCAFVGVTTVPNDTCLIVSDPFESSATGDIHLKPGSAGLQDKGKNYEGIEALVDYEGAARLSGSAVDIGAYELDAAQFTCSFTCDKTEGFKGDTFTFTSELANAPTGVTFTYAWTFDNNNGTVVASEEQNPAIELGVGTWDVTLTVTTSTGKMATAARTSVATVAVRDLYAVVGGTGTFPYDEESKGTSDIAALLALTIDGSTIHFGAGEFLVTSEIVINRGITLSGAGMFNTTIKQTKAGLRVMTINHANAVCEKLTIKGGNLDVRKEAGDSKGISIQIGLNGGTFRECRVTGGNGDNHYQYGHVAVVGEAGHVDRCLVDCNTNMFQSTSGDGYGIIYVGAGLVENCMVSNNYAFTGGGAYVVGGTLRNCTFYKNDALACGGVYATGGSVVNCVMANDTSLTNDKSTGRPEWGGTAACFANCAFTTLGEGCVLPGATSFIANNPFNDATAGDFTPAAGSGGLRDAGDTYAGADTEVDYLGNPRLSGSAIDIGCIEADATAFACSVDATPTACFVGTSVQFTSTILNAPAGVTFGYNWTITDRFGNVTESHEANPVLELPAGFYSIALTVYNVDKPSSKTSITPLVDYVHVAVRDSYATAGNAVPVYPFDTADKGSTNILELIAEAIAGTTIHVGPGVFTNSAEMIVASGITITGAGRDQSTVVAGPHGLRVLRIANASAVCEKMTITGGSNNTDYNKGDYLGTAVWITDQGGTLRDCRICDNVAYGYYQDGAVHMSGNGLVDRCIIEDNTNVWREVDSSGGGIAASKGIVQNCLVRNNTATSGGGARITGTAVMRNCTLVGNHAVFAPERGAGGAGGGLAIRKAGGTIENCVLWGNTSAKQDDLGGSEICFFIGSYDEGSQYTFRSTAVPTSVTSTLGGLVKIADPIFRNAEAGNYRLRTASPCRNAGRNGAWASAAKDLDGQPRLYGKAIDLGCYELQQGYGTTLIVR